MMRQLTVVCIGLMLMATVGFSLTLSDLEPVGAGDVHYLGFIKVYDAALYASRGASSDDILKASASHCLVLDYDVALSAEQFALAADEILANQHSEEALADHASAIKALHDAYRGVSEGDRYALCFNADSQETGLSLNGEELVRIRSREFAKMYMGIWLAESGPIDKTLQQQLLEPGRR